MKRFARKSRIAPPAHRSYAVTMQTELQNETQNENHWQQVMARDARQDGRFVFAVRTTGVYCRPSCPSRRPRRDSVEFFPDPREAERAGYRACLRCKPTEISAQAKYVLRARQLLDNAEGVVTLAQLSKSVGLSPFHLQRLFKRATGLSPREYQSARRMQHVKTELRKGEDVTTALYDAGFGSPSRLYEKSDQHLGMTPGTYRRGGAGATITFAIAPTPLGRMLVAATERGLCAVRFGESATELERGLRIEFHAAQLHRDDAAMRRYVEPLLASLAARRPRSICRSMCAPPLSSRKSGRRCNGFRAAKRAAIPKSRARSAIRKQCARWLGLARRIQWRWPCRVIVSSAAMATRRDIGGEWSARRSYWKANNANS